MQNLKRNINMGFRVTEEEQELIRKRMAQTSCTNIRTYLLKQAIDGRVITLDLISINECSSLLSKIGTNINQIAKHSNTIGAVYGADMKSIQNHLTQIWEQ